MTPRWRARVFAALALPLVLGGCGAEPPSAPDDVTLPEGLAVYVDQSRIERAGRDVFVRLLESTLARSR